MMTDGAFQSYVLNKSELFNLISTEDWNEMIANDF